MYKFKGFLLLVELSCADEAKFNFLIKLDEFLFEMFDNPCNVIIFEGEKFAGKYFVDCEVCVVILIGCQIVTDGFSSVSVDCKLLGIFLGRLLE